MSESYHDKHGISQFLTDLAPKETPWDTHRSNAQSVQMLYEYSEEFNKYAERINGCSGILKFGFGEDKLVLKQAFFAVYGSALSANGVGLCYGEPSCFRNLKKSKRSTLPIDGCF